MACLCDHLPEEAEKLGLAVQPLFHRLEAEKATTRPAADQPRPGKRWDYPRPSRLEPVPERLRVIFDSVTVADTV